METLRLHDRYRRRSPPIQSGDCGDSQTAQQRWRLSDWQSAIHRGSPSIQSGEAPGLANSHPNRDAKWSEDWQAAIQNAIP